jgi:hypothetical protein
MKMFLPIPAAKVDAHTLVCVEQESYDEKNEAEEISQTRNHEANSPRGIKARDHDKNAQKHTNGSANETSGDFACLNPEPKRNVVQQRDISALCSGPQSPLTAHNPPFLPLTSPIFSCSATMPAHRGISFLPPSAARLSKTEPLRSSRPADQPSGKTEPVAPPTSSAPSFVLLSV